MVNLWNSALEALFSVRIVIIVILFLDPAHRSRVRRVASSHSRMCYTGTGRLPCGKLVRMGHDGVGSSTGSNPQP